MTCYPANVASYYVFDSNFFINLHQVFPEPVVSHIAESIRALDGAAYVTDLVMDEISTLKYDRTKRVVDDIAKDFKVERINPPDLDALESRIGKERSPQRTDLSLMVLADRLGSQGPAFLVSDDFKIHTSQEQHGLKFKMLSPAAFLLDLSNRVPESYARQTYRRLYRQVRRKEVEYMLSRRDTYNLEPKISWLVDNLLGTGADARSQDQSRIVAVSEKEDVDMAPVYRYVAGEKVRGSKLTPFQRILPHLDFLKESRGANEEVRILVDAGAFKDALQVVQTASSRLRRHLQEAVLQLDETDSMKLKQVYAHYLAHYNFVQGFLSISVGNLMLAEECLDGAAFCALITKDNDDIVKASYIKALIYFSMEDYSESREQFATTERLAKRLGIQEMEFRGVFGKSITAFLTGKKDLAHEAVQDVRRMIEELGMDATHAIRNFADHVYHFGKAEVALAIYNDALECALEWGQTEDVRSIAEAITQCHFTLNDAGITTDIELERLIDKAHDLAQKARTAYFQEIQVIAEQEAMEMKPLDVLVQDWTMGKDLPAIYKGWMEVVKFVPVREPSDGTTGTTGLMHTLVLGYVPNIGTLGIYLKGDTETTTGVERFHARLKEDGQFKVLDAPVSYRRRYGVRGVIGPKEPAHVELRRVMAGTFDYKSDLAVGASANAGRPVIKK